MNDEHDLTEAIEQAAELAQLLGGISKAYDDLPVIDLDEDIARASELLSLLQAIRTEAENQPDLPE